MMRILLIAAAFLMMVPTAFGQEQEKVDDDQTRLYYRSFLLGGATVTSRGMGLNFRKGSRITGFKKRLLAAELVTMKHPKEYKSFNPYFDDSKGFVFGKLNSLTVLRPSYGLQKVMFSKEAKRGVQISYIVMGGPSIGFVKPVFLEIANPSVANKITVSTEQYNPEEHSIDEIFGRAPALTGLDELKIYPGIQGKFALNFEYAPDDDKIRALEAGVAFDLYHKEVPMMAFAANNQLWYSFYLNWQFGKKSF